MSETPEQLFTLASFFLVRKPTLAFDDFLQLFKDLESFDKLTVFYDNHPLIKEAIALASPSLFAALERGDRSNDTLFSLLKYFIRMTSRSTPFGLFSSVSLGGWGDTASAFLDLQKRERRTRPDMEWLSKVITEICHEPAFFKSLTIKQNPLVRQVGNCFEISYFREPEKKKVVTIRRLPLTEVIFALTKKPVLVSTLIEQILLALPELEKTKIEDVVKTLLDQEFLWFSLFPSLLTTSPLQDFLAKLTQEQRAFFTNKEKQQTVQIDMFEQGKTATLPACVAEEVTKTADLLARLSYREDILGLNDYKNKFIEKYGTQRLVPLLELLSEERGLGIPDVYQEHLPRKKNDSDQEIAFRKLLHHEYVQCLHEGKQEIDITKILLPNEPTTEPKKVLQPSLELYFEIISDSAKAVEEGNFLLLNTYQTWQGGATFGRFLDLFDTNFHDEFKNFIESEENLNADMHFIESSHLPQTVHVQNVGIHPTFRKEIIDLTASDKSTIALDEIFVGSDFDRLFLTSKDGKKEFYVTMGNMINPALAPVPLRFIRDVSKSKYKLLLPFSWGELSSMPFLPRICAGKIILSPSQWNVHQKQLNNRTFSAWADHWKMGRYVFLTMGDQKLLLDRSNPLVLQFIERQLKKGNLLKLNEKVGQEKGQWLESERGKHCAEFVFPLLRKEKQIEKQTRQQQRVVYTPISSSQRWKLPGSEWLFVKFYLPQQSELRFLTEHLTQFVDFLQEQKIIKNWFFIRYGNEKSHVRVRFNGEPKTLVSNLLPILESWSSHLLEEGIIKEISLASYEREIERYGGTDLIETVENFFCADSQTALALLLEQYSLPDYAIGALSILEMIPGTLEERVAFLGRRAVKKNDLEHFQKWKRPLISIAEAILTNNLMEKEAKLFQALNLRQEALFQLHAQMGKANQQSILDSLIHMHCNRLFGVDAKLESKARAHAFHILSSLQQKIQNHPNRLSLGCQA